MSISAENHEWTAQDTADYLTEILKYPIKSDEDNAYIASKIAELSAALRQAPDIDEQTYEAINELSHDHIAYAEPLRLAATRVLTNYALDHSDQSPRVLESLLITLIDQNPLIRKKAVSGIGEIGFSNPNYGEQTIKHLTEEVKDEHPDVVHEAVIWTGNIGHTQEPQREAAMNALTSVLESSAEYEIVQTAIKWTAKIGKQEFQDDNPAIDALNIVIQPNHKFASTLGSDVVDGLAGIAKISQEYAAQSLPVLASAFEVQGSDKLHYKASQAIWNIGVIYPELKVEAIKLLSDAISDTYKKTSDHSHEGASSLIGDLEWSQFPGQELREIFTDKARGEEAGHKHAKDLLAQLDDSQRTHIDSLSPSSKSGLRQRR